MKSALIAIIFTLSSVIITNGDPITNQGQCGGGNRLVIPSRGWESGATLKQGKELKSCNGKFHLKMQTDGNLVLYKNTHHDHHVDNTKSVIWSSETNGKGPNAKLVMQDDNNLVLYRYNRERGPDYIAMWSTDTQGVGINYASDGVRIKSAVAILQNDGNFVVYSDEGDIDDPVARDPIWSTNTHSHGK